jgi:chromosome partitioning protein
MSRPATAPAALPLNRIYDIATLISEQAETLSSSLRRQSEKLFPPNAQRPLRLFQSNEVARFLDVDIDRLRNLSLEDKGPQPMVTQSKRRLYNLAQIHELRAYLDANNRAAKPYLPRRRHGEHLQVIAVVNFKGGSCKTTTAVHLAQHLVLRGHRVLMIDLDPQASLTALHGVLPEIDVQRGQTLYGAVRLPTKDRETKVVTLHSVPLTNCIRPTNFPWLDLVPGGLELTDFEYEAPPFLIDFRGEGASAEFFGCVGTALRGIDERYDVVVVDCPPNLGYLTMATLGAATGVLITVHPQMLDVMSMAQFLASVSTIYNALKDVNITKEYDFLRYLPTRYDPSDGPQRAMVNYLRKQFPAHVMQHAMVKSVAISESGIRKKSLLEDDRSKFTSATYDRAMECLDRVNGEIEQLIHQAWGR